MKFLSPTIAKLSAGFICFIVTLLTVAVPLDGPNICILCEVLSGVKVIVPGIGTSIFSEAGAEKPVLYLISPVSLAPSNPIAYVAPSM
jgi:hypothetical protein